MTVLGLFTNTSTLEIDYWTLQHRQNFVDVALTRAFGIRRQAQTREGSSTGIDAGVSVETSEGANISNF
jgi:hypothetical protein